MPELKEFKLPDVGEGMEEAEIVRWLVKPGDTVKIDQIMLEIQTDKALVEIPSPVAGTVADIKVQEGQIAHVGTVLVAFDTGTKQGQPTASKEAALVSSQGRGDTKPTISNTVPNKEAAVSFATNLSGQVASTMSPVVVAANQNTGNGHSAVTSPNKVRAAPAVRKRALELNVDLTQVQPSSPEGRVLLQDVLNFAERQSHNPVEANRRTESAPTNSQANAIVDVPTTNGHAQTVRANDNLGEPFKQGTGTTAEKPKIFVPTFEGGAAQEERKALTGLRRRIAERMEQSWRTIPHVATFDDADGEQLVALRKRLLPAAEKRGIRLTYLPLIVKIAVQALKQHPIFNSSLDEQTREIIYKRDYHIGLATATLEGLLVPVVRYADRLSLLQLATEINRLTEGARNRTLKGSELSGSTFTITNFGSFGGQRGTPIINPPEAAILGVGQLKEQAVARDGQVVVRPILPLTLSFDHRLIDGADGGAFTRTLVELLENPNLLMLDMV